MKLQEIAARAFRIYSNGVYISYISLERENHTESPL